MKNPFLIEVDPIVVEFFQIYGSYILDEKQRVEEISFPYTLKKTNLENIYYIKEDDGKDCDCDKG